MIRRPGGWQQVLNTIPSHASSYTFLLSLRIGVSCRVTFTHFRPSCAVAQHAHFWQLLTVIGEEFGARNGWTLEVEIGDFYLKSTRCSFQTFPQ